MTRRADSTLVIAASNWVEPEVQGSRKTVTFGFSGVAEWLYAEVCRVYVKHWRFAGCVGRRWEVRPTPRLRKLENYARLRKSDRQKAIAIQHPPVYTDLAADGTWRFWRFT